MKIKKFVASILTVSFVSLFGTPLSNSVEASTNNMSLSEFLKTTDKVEASYPSIRISASAQSKVNLAAKTPIVITSVDTISADEITSGTKVKFKVEKDIKDVNGNTLIKAGTPVSAQITFSKPKLRIGHSGEVTVEDFSTNAVDGTVVPLSATVSDKPKNKMTLSIVLSVFICPLFLLMRGEEAIIPAGTQQTAYTVKDVYIKPSKI